jgi:hypothetical protein
MNSYQNYNFFFFKKKESLLFTPLTIPPAIVGIVPTIADESSLVEDIQLPQLIPGS